MTIIISNTLKCDECGIILADRVFGKDVARQLRQMGKEKGWVLECVDAGPPWVMLRVQRDVCPSCLKKEKVNNM